jgi:hypothetical protein
MLFFSIIFKNDNLIRDAGMTGLQIISAVILDTILVIRTLLNVSPILCPMTAHHVNVLIIVALIVAQRRHVFRTPNFCTMVFQ